MPGCASSSRRLRPSASLSRPSILFDISKEIALHFKWLNLTSEQMSGLLRVAGDSLSLQSSLKVLPTLKSRICVLSWERHDPPSNLAKQNE
jgi:hypothetical protein